MIGSQFILLDSVDSTNNYLKQLVISEKPNEGTVVIAQEQTAGRGQRENYWESNKGENIIMSFVVYPFFLNASNQFMLSKIVALGVVDFLKNYIDEVKIKWPNDIYIKENKIAGILIENTLLGNKISSSVVGIGININQYNFDKSIPNPTSLCKETGYAYNIKELFDSLISNFNKWYQLLKADRMDKIDIEYLGLLYRYQQLHQYKAGDEVFNAKIVDIDHFGRLCLVNEKKELLQFGFKEVQFL
jgi:BirA family biotin operon repressor/biotin-[acetyl-CoA-carboxylase] ligase